MKIAILGDTHFGARNSHQTLQHWQKRFYDEIFWPYIEENNISTVIQTGDYFDNRKFLNVQTIAFQDEVFIQKAQELNVTVHGIVGNHDIPYRYSLKNSSVDQILNKGAQTAATFYDKVTTIDFDGQSITFMPWICKDNYDECIEVIEKGGDILLGHFEIEGFVMHPGAVSKEGIAYSDFKNWNQVISGHYHTQSVKGNVRYVGTPYQMSWSDSNTKHGFWILDTHDGSIQFKENPYRYFNRIVWKDGCEDVNYDLLKDSFVKVSVEAKTDFELFETFIDRVNYNSPYELKIIESYEEYNEENVKDLIQVSTTEDLIAEYIEDVATIDSTESIKKMMLDIYEQAVHLED